MNSRDGQRVLYAGEPLPHFNEVDECAGLDGLMTYRVHKAMGQPVENTLHDLRWGDVDRSGTVDDYVWVFLISGRRPPAHFIDGWAGTTSERQPAMYFRLGGGTLKGISKPGEIVWSRIYIERRPTEDGPRPRAASINSCRTRKPSAAGTRPRRSGRSCTPSPTASSRDQMMARHKANHIQVAYAKSPAKKPTRVLAKAAMAESLGMEAFLCGTRKNGAKWSARTLTRSTVASSASCDASVQTRPLDRGLVRLGLAWRRTLSRTAAPIGAGGLQAST